MLNPYLEGPLKPRCPSIPPAAALEVLSARSDVKAQKHRWKGAGLSFAPLA